LLSHYFEEPIQVALHVPVQAFPHPVQLFDLEEPLQVPEQVPLQEFVQVLPHPVGFGSGSGLGFLHPVNNGMMDTAAITGIAVNIFLTNSFLSILLSFIVLIFFDELFGLLFSHFNNAA